MTMGIRLGSRQRPDIEFFNGLVLFGLESNHFTGAGAKYIFIFIKYSKHRLVLSSGLHFIFQTSYSQFSDLYAYLNQPIRFRRQSEKGTIITTRPDDFHGLRTLELSPSFSVTN